MSTDSQRKELLPNCDWPEYFEQHQIISGVVVLLCFSLRVCVCACMHVCVLAGVA